MNQAWAFYNIKEYDRAINSYDYVLEIDPRCDEAFYMKACCCSQLGKVELTIEMLKQVIRLNPDEYREYIYKQTEFDHLRKNKSFQELVSSLSN